MTTPLERLDTLLDQENGAEVHLTLEVATDCFWSGELRITPNPNREDGPDRSFVWFATAGEDPAEVIGRLLDDVDDWVLPAEGES